MRALLSLLILISALVPAPIDASCASDPCEGCAEAEHRMMRRAQEQMEAAQKRVVFVETGKDRIKTTVFDVLYDHTNECHDQQG